MLTSFSLVIFGLLIPVFIFAFAFLVLAMNTLASTVLLVRGIATYGAGFVWDMVRARGRDALSQVKQLGSVIAFFVLDVLQNLGVTVGALVYPAPVLAKLRLAPPRIAILVVTYYLCFVPYVLLAHFMPDTVAAKLHLLPLLQMPHVVAAYIKDYVDSVVYGAKLTFAGK